MRAVAPVSSHERWHEKLWRIWIWFRRTRERDGSPPRIYHALGQRTVTVIASAWAWRGVAEVHTQALGSARGVGRATPTRATGKSREREARSPLAIGKNQ